MTGRVDDGHRAEEHLTRGPVDRDRVPGRQHDVPEADLVPARSRMPSAPTTAHVPMPRATTAACDVLPPRAVRMPSATIMPCRSSGLVSLRTRMTCAPLPTAFQRLRVVQHDLADRRTRRRRHRPGQQPSGGRGVELREQQLAELVARAPRDRLVHRDQALVDQLGRDPERCRCRALAHPRLEQPELAALDGELDVAQVAVVRLEASHRLPQRLVRRRVEQLQLGQREGVADARDDVLALRVGQVVAVHARRPGGRVPREAHAGPGGLAEVAEHHAHHVHGGAQVVRDALATPVEPGAVRVPRAEDRLDRHVELLARVLRELAARPLEHDLLERVHEDPQVLRVQVDVGRRTDRALALVESRLERLAVDAQHRLAEHLDQPAVRVPREALVARELGRAPSPTRR